MCAWILWIWSLSPSKHPRPYHAPIVIVIQSEHLKHSVSPRNQSAKHPDSGCFGISGVVIGSALSKVWRSGSEAFREGHFLRLDRNQKPRMKSIWHPGYTPPDLLARISKPVERKKIRPDLFSENLFSRSNLLWSWAIMALECDRKCLPFFGVHI